MPVFPSLTRDQQRAVLCVQTGQNVWIWGQESSGKTLTLKCAFDRLMGGIQVEVGRFSKDGTLVSPRHIRPSARIILFDNFEGTEEKIPHSHHQLIVTSRHPPTRHKNTSKRFCIIHIQ
jgi:hypothetical protein